MRMGSAYVFTGVTLGAELSKTNSPESVRFRERWMILS